ncbi:MAG: electron transfer flavoprotein subunit beta/FixA family protein [Immundisolibacteraceae bacterium]|nr:electron transfer flavoprotein subunit beta/FixA family protein [Immundisolibacteraceae bacterium]
MKILVGIKRVVDYNVRIRVKPDGSGVVTDGVKMSMNPFDEIAVEEALQIKERGECDEIIVISIGAKQSQEQLRTALAMGADRGVHVLVDEQIEPLTASKAILSVAQSEGVDLILLGKQAIDDDNNQTAQMVAALWDRPQATFASELAFTDGKVTAVREVDAGLEVLEVDLPAVISVDLRLNEPRYVKLPDMMKAKKKTIDVKSLEDLGVTSGAGVTSLGVRAPEGRQAGIKVETVEELVKELQARGLVND